MKKNIFKHLLLCLPMLAGLIMSSCSEDDIVFDSELPQFELKADKVLLEVLVPGSTLAEDQLYICGDWNKTEDGYAKDDAWKLTRSTSAPGRAEYKWGIYLDPSVNLGAGYHFFSQNEGVERTVFNTDSIHTVNPGVGNRANIVVNRWESFFKSQEGEDDPVIEHDGYVVYVDDQTGWEDLTLYMWGDTNDLNGGWPGMSVTGEVTLQGVKLKYFDMGEANTGLNENLIFNNGGNGAQLPDFNFTIDRDVYLRITESGVEEFELTPTIKHDGFVVYVDNQTSWEDPITLYMWGDENNLNGDWPGMPITGVEKINGVEYSYFDLGAANEGLNENLIFNNSGNGKQLPDFNFTIERNVFLVLTDKGVTEVEPGQGVDPTPDPTPDPQPAGKHKFYILNNAGWDAVYVYAWSGSGDPEICGGWPGALFSGKETIDGVEYLVAEFDANDGEYHFIINNNAGTQFDDVVVGPANVDYFKTLTADGVSSRHRVRK